MLTHLLDYQEWNFYKCTDFKIRISMLTYHRLKSELQYLYVIDK